MSSCCHNSGFDLLSSNPFVDITSLLKTLEDFAILMKSTIFGCNRGSPPRNDILSGLKYGCIFPKLNSNSDNELNFGEAKGLLSEQPLQDRLQCSAK